MPKVQFQFPYLGLNTGEAVENQPPGTSGYLKNVRPYDVLEQRKRGGPRPGLDKRYSQQIGGYPSPIVAIESITVVT